MKKYRIFPTEGFVEDIKEVSKSGFPKVDNKLRNYVYPQLSQQPYFGKNIKKLKNWKPETWRYRVGSWRLFYQVDEKERIVFMIAAEHRSESYG